MRDVEALDALRQFRQADGFLQFLLDLLGVWFEHAKSLVVGLLRVVAREVDQRALVAALRNQNMHARTVGVLTRALLGEQVLQCFAVLKIDRDVEVPRNIRLANVELRKQSGKKLAGMKVCANRLVILGPAFFAGRRACPELVEGICGLAGCLGAAGRLHRSFASLRMTSRGGVGGAG